MPQAVGIWIAQLAAGAVTGLTAVGFSTAIAVGIVDVGLTLVGMSLLNSLYDKFLVPDVGKSSAAFTVTIRGTTEHCRIIYGQTLASGVIWYINATDVAGTKKRSLYYGIAIADHECEDITDAWIDDNQIPEGYINWATDGAVNSGDFRGKTGQDEVLFFEKFLGASGQAASTTLNTAFSDITSAHRGQGITWGQARLDYFKAQAQVWSSGYPNDIKFLVTGKKVYDPRSDSTQSFGTGPHRVDSSPTWEYSNNPALVYADYMIDTRLGFGESTARIDYGYVASAAEICDGIVYTPVGTSRRFTCNGILSTGDAYETNVKKILSSMNGSHVLENGTWKVRAFGYETPTLQFNENHLRGDMQIKLHPAETTRYNTVRGEFIDPERLWKSSEFPAFTSSEYVSRDNGDVLYRDLALHMTKDVYEAQRLAAGILEQSDLEKTVVLPLNYYGMPASIGGTIMVTNEKMGWTDKVFRVEKYKFSDMAGIDMVAREDSSAAYTDVGTAEYTVGSNNGLATDSPIVPEPSSFQIYNDPYGIQLRWVNPAARLYDTTEIFRSVDSNWNNAVSIGEVKVDNFLDVPPQDQVNFYFVRSTNYLGDVSSYVPVGSSAFGIYNQPSMVIASDPTFEQSKPLIGQYSFVGTGSRGLFWDVISYFMASGGNNVGYAAKVFSDATGTGSSHILRMNFWVGSDASGASVAAQVSNRRFVPIIRGQGVTQLLRYRVTSYTNVLSAQIFFQLMARENAWEAGATALASPLTINLTNSVDWTVTSKYTNISVHANIGSYSLLQARLTSQINYTPTDTGYLCVEFDDAYAFFNDG